MNDYQHGQHRSVSCLPVIAHVDLDCFYAQVEALRLGIDCRNVPYVLLQWQGLIAVNYPARARGISRFEPFADALAKCPELKYSHVATYEVGDPVYRYHTNPSKATHKVSLDPYRHASRDIFEVLRSFDDVVVEKGGVDEAFLDLTVAANKQVQQWGDVPLLQLAQEVAVFTRTLPDASCAPFLASSDVTCTRENLVNFLKDRNIGEVEDFSPAPTEQHYRAFLAGAVVVHNMREAVRTRLGYDCSAGIAHNRMLAKSMSAVFKPNQQTLLFPDQTLSYLRQVKFSKLRGFGGKLGDQVQQACDGAETCGDMWQFSVEDLQCRFSSAGMNDVMEVAHYVYRKVRGFDDTPVKPRTMSKSLLAEKVFSPPTLDLDVLRQWFTVLSNELLDRLRDFCLDWGVCGHRLLIRMGSGGLMNGTDVGNRTFPLPTPTTADALLLVATTFAQHVVSTERKQIAAPTVRINVVSMQISDFRKVDSATGRDVLQNRQTTLDTLFSRCAQRKRPRGDAGDTEGQRGAAEAAVNPAVQGHHHGVTEESAASELLVCDVDTDSRASSIADTSPEKAPLNDKTTQSAEKWWQRRYNTSDADSSEVLRVGTTPPKATKVVIRVDSDASGDDDEVVCIA